ncbi:DtxR family Mn-dependent transcriptional regulator [Deinobacterium chartae]|uniref:Manganese transport regulator n=1 Tax=Deinobacterium chartae TaxID=521158 RepID=A0A841I311_9DEIO|nr:metal-dependent transcriptional regulator [Deinobacterium chartae]MBB6098800.1 DtxR family Mn-dependent transcriptional regulator [Deinobacterium chartae]
MPTSEPIRKLLSAQAEDYLKAIYLLGRSGKVSTQSLAAELGVTPASVSGMLKKLAELGLVDHKPYYGAVLSATGERVALEIVRHHRLLELYLTQALGYSWDEVHAEADRLEHVISEELEARISQVLGDPHYDPHGHPIPRLDGTVPEAGGHVLRGCLPGDRVRMLWVSDQEAAFLRYLTELGLSPGAEFVVQEVDLLGGTLTLRIDATERVLGLEAASRVWVRNLEEHSAPHEARPG